MPYKPFLDLYPTSHYQHYSFTNHKIFFKEKPKFNMILAIITNIKLLQNIIANEQDLPHFNS